MSGIFTINVSEARGNVAIPANLDALACVIGCSSGGAVTSGLSPFYLSATAAITGIGYGDTADTLCQIIEQRQSSGSARKIPACAYLTPADTDGSYGAVDDSAVTGTAVATAHAATKPRGTYEARIKWMTNGFIGTSGLTYKWSLDGGRTYSRTLSLGTASTITIPNSGVQLDYSPAASALAALNTLLADLATQYEAHRILTAGAVHGAADSTNAISATTPPTNTAERVALANDLRAKYNAHRIRTAGGVHGAADSTNAITAPVATDDASALTLALDLKTKYAAHRVLTAGAVHGAADSTNVVTAPNPAAGSRIAGDVDAVRTLAPTPGATDVDNAFAALAASSTDVGIVVCEFPCDAAMAAHITTGLNTMLAAGKRCVAIVRTRIPDAETSETDATWTADIIADYDGFEDSRINVRAAYGLITDAATTRQYLRSDLAQWAADVCRVSISDMPNVPADQAESNFTLVDADGVTIGHDEGVRGAATGLSDEGQGNRFSSVMRLPDSARRESVFATVPWVMYAADERITNLPTRRVVNALERVAVSAGTSALGEKLYYTPADPNTPGSTAMLTEASRNALHGVIFGALSAQFGPHIQNANDAAVDTGLVQVDPVVTVSGGNLLTVSVTIAPLVFGYLLNLNIVLAVQQ